MPILVSFAALFTGLSLGLLGGGGSILAVPVLVYGAGFTAREAIASSLLIVGLSSLLGALTRWRQVQGRTALAYAAWGMAGTYAGARLATWFSDSQQMTLFSLVVLVVAALMLRKATPAGQARPRPMAVPALAGGVLTGLVGVGGGFLIVPTLVLAGGLEMPAAIATSLLVIAMNSVAGLLGYLGSTPLQPVFLAAFTGLVMSGLLAGAWLVPRVPAHRLKQGFAVFLLVVGSLTLYQNL